MFGKSAAKVPFKADVIAADDPVLDILKASSVGRALLALNSDADQRLYKTRGDSLSSAFRPKRQDLDKTAGLYMFDSDAILLRKQEAESLVEGAYTIAHELAHRFQQRQIGGAKLSFQNEMEENFHTLLTEIHADTIADIVFLQAIKAHYDKEIVLENREEVVHTLLEHVSSDTVKKYLTTDNLDEAAVMQEIFFNRLNEVLEEKSSYLKTDVENGIKADRFKDKKSFYAGTMAFLFGVSAGTSLASGNITLGLSLTLITGALGAASVMLGKKHAREKASQDVNLQGVFKNASAGLVPQEASKPLHAIKISRDDPRMQLALLQIREKADIFREEYYLNR